MSADRVTRRIASLIVGALIGAATAACSGAPASPTDGMQEHETPPSDAGRATNGDANADVGVGQDSSTPTDAVVGPDVTVPDSTTSEDSGIAADSGPNLGWTGQTNIDSIFETYCAGCHGAQWSSCWNVQANATNIDEMVSSGAMPRNGPLPPAVEMTLLDWLEAGAPCTGQDDPYDAGGGPPPPPSAP